MNAPKPTPEKDHRVAQVLRATALCCAIGALPACADEARKTPGASAARTDAPVVAREPAPTQPSGAPGMKAYVDPETGELTSPPEGDVRETPDAAFSTSSEGLAETESPVEGGGVMVDLKGRFRKPVTATVDENGKLSIGHGQLPAEAERK